MILLLPFVLYAVAMAWDELYFHHRRGLPLWERLGHPLDTITLAVCVAWTVMRPYTPENLDIFLGLSLFSCLFVTKDEFLHARACAPAENWVHSLLFILHPVCLGVTGWIWVSWPWPQRAFLPAELAAVLGFLLYQIIFWNFLWNRKLRSTTNSTTT